ncbi:Lsr2 family protein [Corynebacterium urealyticum]|uniref:histone-like nucleoid-structuring protein Lsr2 n=1 Tax=Corynebacterium urealyticum TaxID=43771 RepID=UPI0011E6907D|nr:Lsr2 family protein [Corynebacterium urealyticum]TYR18977.1 Lsr2 family protein [Corynebacterium urealyticum]
MARKEITQYFDDIDNAPLAAEDVNVVEFAVDGVTYSMDVSTANREKFEEALAPYIAVARRVQRTSARHAPQSTNSPERSRAIREWAQANGLQVSDRGRIPQDIVDKYDAAHS